MVVFHVYTSYTTYTKIIHDHTTIVNQVTHKYLMKRELEDVETVTGSDQQRRCSKTKKSLVYALTKKSLDYVLRTM
jgi:hypothetical protein